MPPGRKNVKKFGKLNFEDQKSLCVLELFSKKKPEKIEVFFTENEFEELVSWIRNLIHDRCSLIDPSELQNTMNLFERRVEFWKSGFQYYGDARNSGMLNQGRVPLMYTQGSEVTEEIRTRGLSVPTQTSMRGVDEEGKVGILNIH